ncbi:MAG TPA: ribonuclease D [Actinomycetes bacterium]
MTDVVPEPAQDDLVAESTAIPLIEPREGVPPVVAGATALAATVEAFRSGTGPVAVDAERASGYRYGQRAYLVQLRRTGSGSALVDPVGCPDLSTLGEALADAEWVLHAANQDLPCLAEIGLRPTRIFDTELAGRLAGYPRVGLGPLVEEVLGFALEKGHAAADWSTRPLPEPWLRYAALDVEVLIELRDAIADVLEQQGKLAWAYQEFAAIAAAPPAEPRIDPWRRTSGLHRVRGRRQLAIVRSLWEARDDYARRRDVAPGRVLPDTALVEAALLEPKAAQQLAGVTPFNGQRTRRHLPYWWAAVETALALPADALPPTSVPNDSPPPARAWADRDPAAAARLAAARTAVAAIADEHGLPVENLLAPDSVRRLCWEPPDDVSVDGVTKVLHGNGARPWQIELTAVALSGALSRLRLRSEG